MVENITKHAGWAKTQTRKRKATGRNKTGTLGKMGLLWRRSRRLSNHLFSWFMIILSGRLFKKKRFQLRSTMMCWKTWRWVPLDLEEQTVGWGFPAIQQWQPFRQRMNPMRARKRYLLPFIIYVEIKLDWPHCHFFRLWRVKRKMIVAAPLLPSHR